MKAAYAGVLVVLLLVITGPAMVGTYAIAYRRGYYDGYDYSAERHNELLTSHARNPEFWEELRGYYSNGRVSLVRPPWEAFPAKATRRRLETE